MIRALNEDLPFDQFTIQQIAGDLLPPDARRQTLDPLVATGFHRNTMLNEEGGIDPLEFRFYAMVDRVATTGTTWLGLTMGCGQCHAHKFAPVQIGMATALSGIGCAAAARGNIGIVGSEPQYIYFTPSVSGTYYLDIADPYPTSVGETFTVSCASVSAGNCAGMLLMGSP